MPRQLILGGWFAILIMYSTVNQSQTKGALPNFHFNELSTRNGLSQSSVFCMIQDSKGFMWIGTRDGLNRYDGYSFLTYKHNPSDTNSLSNNEITTLYNDSQENLWIGTRGGGITHFNVKKNKFTRYLKPLSENIIRAFIESDGAIWAGTSEGLLKLTPVSNSARYELINVSEKALYWSEKKRLLPHSRTTLSVTALNQLIPDRIIVGTDAGVFEYMIQEQLFRRTNLPDANSNVITSLLSIPPSTLWIGSYDGLFKTQLLNNQLQTDEASTSNNQQKPIRTRVESIVSDKEKNIWVGTRGEGLYRIDCNGNLLNINNNPMEINSLSENIINSLFVDKTGGLWVGTESQGCNYIDLYKDAGRVLMRRIL